MPWIRAKLREQLVYARVDEQGQLVTVGGRVEVRYRPNDGRLYQAAARNLTVADATVLPDATCSPADAVQKTKPGARASGAARAGGAADPAPAAGSPSHPSGARSGSRSGKARAARPSEPSASTVQVYTDGACSGNPGPAGLGVVIVRPGERLELSEYLGRATNNIAELTAVLRALSELDEHADVRIHTDSQYTIGVVQKGWKAKANQELVAELKAALGRHPHVKLAYVPGHEGVPLNERCDELARRAIAQRGSSRQLIPA